MLTGRYPSAHRVKTNYNARDAYFTKDLFDVFKSNGYRTALIGKNHSHLTPNKTDFWYEASHLGIDDPMRTSEEEAFDEWLKTTHFHMAIDPAPFPLECQIPYRLVTKAQNWIKSANKPFLLWLSFPEPHNPYQVPEPYHSMFPPDSCPQPKTDASALDIKGFKYQWCRRCFEIAFPDFEETLPRARSNYLGMLRLLDDQIQRLIAFIDSQGLREDTIIVFLSDHGDFVGEYGLLRKGPEMPEPLVRIPLQFNGPGILQMAGPHPAHVSITDIMPTLCEAVGITLPDGVQGRSLWPLLTGNAYPEDEFASAYVEQGFGGLHYCENDTLDPTKDGLSPAIFEDVPQSPLKANGTTAVKHTWGAFDCLNSWTQSGTMRMVRKADWKIIFDMQGRGQLYNLAEDPAEVHNLYEVALGLNNQCTETKKHDLSTVCMQLLSDLLQWVLWMQDALPLPKQRYVFKKHPRNYRTDE